ncbi:galactose oxidase [Micractinium conductrix]|uniref:Galactose oxidase n=1 Tax=Micractinium conductrix TaxID=554055 RepID=A0A2P6V6Y1_9CHLO|nr:galactose oxidase [Micractinium conductrix]|eukprot:PSC69828.1 galactose oxidase [Micractinium conductrix]
MVAARAALAPQPDNTFVPACRDARALWLRITGRSTGKLKLAIPSNRAALPPGMYMLMLNSAKGVPSTAKILSIA